MAEAILTLSQALDRAKAGEPLAPSTQAWAQRSWS